MSQTLLNALDCVYSLSFRCCIMHRIYIPLDVFNIYPLNDLNSVSLSDIPIMKQVLCTLPGSLHHSHGSGHFNSAFLNLTYKRLQLVHEVRYTRFNHSTIFLFFILNFFIFFSFGQCVKPL